MSDLITLEAILSLLQANGYWIMFWLMIIEGPIISYASAFASALGIFDIKIVFFLSVLGNSIPDKLFYFIGRFCRGPTLEKFASFFGLSYKRIKKLENAFKVHLGKTIVLTKITPVLTILGPLFAGFTRVNFKKFFIITTSIDIFISLIFIVTGYYSGLAADTTLKYFRLEIYLLPVLIILTVIISYFVKFIYKKLNGNKSY